MLFNLMSFNVNNTSSEKLFSLILLKLHFLYDYYNILSFSVFSYQTDRVEASPSMILINPIYFLSQSLTNLVSILFSRGLSNETFILREATIFAQIYVKTWICVDHQIVLVKKKHLILFVTDRLRKCIGLINFITTGFRVSVYEIDQSDVFDVVSQ